MAEIKTQRLDGYRRLIDIARDLASTLDLDILLSRIVHAAAEISGAEAASILLYDDTSQKLYFQVSTNLDASTQRGLVVPLEGSIAGWIVLNRQAVRIVNAHDDARFFSNIEQATGYSTQSILGIPLVIDEVCREAHIDLYDKSSKTIKHRDQEMITLGDKFGLLLVHIVRPPNNGPNSRSTILYLSYSFEDVVYSPRIE